MKLTYLGTASVLIEIGGVRLITDPVFDASGQTYPMGPSWAPKKWFASTRHYDAPLTPEQVGSVDAALISHDHHFDNLDRTGRAWVLSDAVGSIVTNPHAAKRLAKSAISGLKTGESTTIGDVRITATPARHGPRFTPQVDQVTGFLIEAPSEPTVWISGDTVLTSELRAWATAISSVDVAVINCGAVRFEKAPGFSRARFTFNAAEAAHVVALLDPKVIVPVHRSGWTHFQPEEPFRAAFDPKRTRWLELGESTTS